MPGLRWKEGISLDVRLASRILRKSPALTVIGVLGIALGTAVGVGFFVVIANHFFPSLRLHEADRLVAIENWDVAANRPDERSLHDFITWRDELRSVRPVAAASLAGQDLVTGDALPQSLPGAAMTATGFQIARVPPLLGRYLLPGDESESAPAVVVIGYELWQRLFAGDSRVIGRVVLVNGSEHTIVGVMPRGFTFPANQWLWTPLRASATRGARGAGPRLFVFGRLRPGVTRAQAQAELTVLGHRAAAAFPETNARLRPRLVPYTYPLANTRALRLADVVQVELMTTLLLIAIAGNVSLLVYARTAMRLGEIAMRTALGATRRRIVGQLFVEGLLLSLPGAGLGLAVVHAILGEARLAFDPNPPFWVDYGVQGRSVVFATMAAVLSAVIVGVVPALEATGGRVGAARHLSRSGGSPRLGGTWTVLIVAQVAVVVGVLPPAIHLGYGQLRRQAVTPTFPAHEFLTTFVGLAVPVRPGTDGEAYRRETIARFATALPDLERSLRADPAVAGTTVQEAGGDVPIEVAGAPGAEPGVGFVNTRAVAPDYFALFGARLVAGRPLGAADAGEDGPLIVNEAFVRRVLGGGAALGRRVRFVISRTGADQVTTGPWREIVGVVENLHASALDPEVAPAVAYSALARERLSAVSLIVRVREGDANGFIPRLQRIAAAGHAQIRLGRVTDLAVSPETRYLAALVTALVVALLTVLVLSAVGIHALTSVTVTRRRKELGIRIALGARAGRLLRSIFSRVAWQLGLGGFVGSVLGAVLLRANEAPVAAGAQIVSAVVGLMLLAGLTAAIGPARRALRVEPMDTLRQE